FDEPLTEEFGHHNAANVLDRSFAARQHAEPIHSTGLLGARFARHDGRRGEKCEQGSEPPPHAITSAARAGSGGGIVRPSARAVRRFTTSWNCVGRSMAISAGEAPEKMRAT